MGGFAILSREFVAQEPTAPATLLATMKRGCLGQPTELSTTDWNIYYFPKAQALPPTIVKYPSGEFIFSVGTLIYRNKMGEAALTALLSEFDGTRRIADKCRGSFALIIYHQSQLYVLNDALGVYPVFFDRDLRYISSCFLPIALTLPHVSLASQGIYEYVFNGVVSGNDTLLDEIALLPIGAMLDLKRHPQLQKGGIRAPTEELPLTAEASLERLRSIIQPFFRCVAARFGNRVTCALSGGYDSRLILAFLRDAGINPRLSVYGTPTEEDISVAIDIAKTEDLSLQVVDKNAARPGPEEFANIVEDNYFINDGYSWDGFFDNGTEAAERRARVAGGAIALNGGAGEIMRNFFYLRGRMYRPRELIWSFYSRFDPRSCSSRFEEEVYYRNFESKLDELVGEGRQRLSRVTTDWLYHLFRCRSWDGRANAINGKFGHTALPFLDTRVTNFAARIPHELKDHGLLEAALIARVDRRLAAYPSVYGHPFDRPPPFSRRVADHLTYARPPWLRRFSYRLQHRLGRVVEPWRYLQSPFVKAALPGELQFAPLFFRLDEVKDGWQWTRILSLEYLARRLGSRLSV